MPSDKICKTVHQYNKEPLSREDMDKLLEIARDYSKVKNYVYARFGGIGSLSKLYPGYTIQNEMTASGLRGELELPSIYFYLAVFEALGDIKSQWSNTKGKITKLVAQNSELTVQEKHYLRFLLKVSNAFEAVLNEEPMKLQAQIQRQYDFLAESVDIPKMHRYLCRQVRKHHVKLCSTEAKGFSIAPKAYRYGDHGIYISIKEKRKRIFVPLTDNNQYDRQLYIKLFPEESSLEIKVPVDVLIRHYEDYTKSVGLAVGMQTMVTTDEGHRYGELLGEYQGVYADWIREQKAVYDRNKKDNPGRKKYNGKKNRYEEQLHSYINQELNRFLRTEKPKVVYIPKLPGPQAGGVSKKMNLYATLWQRGYIRSRLEQKCREQSIELVEVLGKNISNECSQCGAPGIKREGIFSCGSCGYQIEEKINGAQNAKKRGLKQYEQDTEKAGRRLLNTP